MIHSFDSTPIIHRIISDSSAYRILFFPEGNYYFKTNLVIKQDGIRIIGEGAQKTQLFQDGGDFTFRPPGTNDTGIALSAPPSRGDTTIISTNADKVKIGDLILPLAQFPFDGQNTSYRNQMAKEGRGQIVQVTGISGNVISINDPIGLNYAPWPNQRLKILKILKDVGIEGVKIEKLREDQEGHADV